MPETPAPAPPPGIGSPTARVPRAALLPATVIVLLTVVGAALVTPVLGCVPSFAWETAALITLTAVWGWCVYRLCRRTARWVLGAGAD